MYMSYVGKENTRHSYACISGNDLARLALVLYSYFFLLHFRLRTSPVFTVAMLGTYTKCLSHGLSAGCFLKFSWLATKDLSAVAGA